jgi:hypothetical protein
MKKYNTIFNYRSSLFYLEWNTCSDSHNNLVELSSDYDKYNLNESNIPENGKMV